MKLPWKPTAGRADEGIFPFWQECVWGQCSPGDIELWSRASLSYLGDVLKERVAPAKSTGQVCYFQKAQHPPYFLSRCSILLISCPEGSRARWGYTQEAAPSSTRRWSLESKLEFERRLEKSKALSRQFRLCGRAPFTFNQCALSAETEIPAHSACQLSKNSLPAVPVKSAWHARGESTPWLVLLSRISWFYNFFI